MINFSHPNEDQKTQKMKCPTYKTSKRAFFLVQKKKGEKKMVYVPKAYFQHIEKCVREISESGVDMEYRQECLKRELLHHAVPFIPEEIPDGKQFGTLVYSPMAYAKRHGMQVRGDVYIGVWNWRLDTRSFWTTSAWGEMPEKKDPTGGCGLLIEL